MKPAPGSADYEFDAANLCELDARWAEANDHYAKAIELCPEFVEAYDNRAGNWVEIGDYANAVSDYHKVIELWPHYAAAHNNLARIYLDADDPAYVNPELAISHAQQACELTHNKCYEFLATYAQACYARRDFQSALRLQKLAVDAAIRLQKNKSADRAAQIDAEIMLPELKERLEQFQQDIPYDTEHASWSLAERIWSWFKGPR